MARDPDLDPAAAITRSLLGWGVVAGPFYLVVGLVLALTRRGFSLAHDSLSLLTLGHLGWLQRATFMLTAVMVAAAAVGILRAVRNGRGLAMGVLCLVDAVALIGAALFRPDPVDGFPPGSRAPANLSASGTLHLLAGAIGFVALAAAAFAYAGWSRNRGDVGQSWLARVLGVLTLLGFVAGAALATHAAGVLLLWVAVVASWSWLALACAEIYRRSPHPLRSLRVTASA